MKVTSSVSKTAAAPAATSQSSGSLQRQCECGQHTLSGECDECKQKKLVLKRTPEGRAGSPVVPPVVRNLLGQDGDPLDSGVRAAMEPHFKRFRSSGRRAAPSPQQASLLTAEAPDDELELEAWEHADTFLAQSGGRRRIAAETRFDFSGVRVHTGPIAVDAARAMNARAFTVGEHVVFGSGQYSPRSPEGLSLIAHELTHVAQQRNDPSGVRIQRATVAQSVGRFVRNVVLFVPYLFGMDMPFSDEELREYLDGLKDHIEGGFFSDDRARAVVKKWKAGVADFRLDLNKKKLLIIEMLDGSVTDGDRQGILELLEALTSEGPDQLEQVSGPGNINLTDVDKAMTKEPYSTRFNGILLQALALGGQPLAVRILQDMRDLKKDKFDFENLRELHDEIFKRMRVSQLLQESQSGHDSAFDYPENLPSTCPDFVPGTAGYTQNARVNKAARSYWTSVILDPQLIYYFQLTPLGKDNAFDALRTLFTPQHEICDKTLIHCDYLLNVVEFRAYAEMIGEQEFNKKVKNGDIEMVLSWNGFPKAGQGDFQRSPKAFAYRNMVPASKEDLVIGDHVTFFNHMAYDGLNSTKMMPWRLENAILIDKKENKDLFQGHGTKRLSEHAMLKELAEAYNPDAEEALRLARDADDGDSKKFADLKRIYPLVDKVEGKWMVTDPGLYGDSLRRGRRYELKAIDEGNLEGDPLLIGLRDPHDPSKMGSVDRPIESAPGPAPRP